MSGSPLGVVVGIAVVAVVVILALPFADVIFPGGGELADVVDKDAIILLGVMIACGAGYLAFRTKDQNQRVAVLTIIGFIVVGTFLVLYVPRGFRSLSVAMYWEPAIHPGTPNDPPVGRRINLLGNPTLVSRPIGRQGDPPTWTHIYLKPETFCATQRLLNDNPYRHLSLNLATGSQMFFSIGVSSTLRERLLAQRIQTLEVYVMTKYDDRPHAPVAC